MHHELQNRYLTGVGSSLQVSSADHPGGDEALVHLRLVAGPGGEERHHGGLHDHAGLPWKETCVRAGGNQAKVNQSNSPSSSVAPHPEIQHMVPSSNSSPWLGRQMGSTNPEEEEEEDNQPGVNSAHFPRK